MKHIVVLLCILITSCSNQKFFQATQTIKEQGIAIKYIQKNTQLQILLAKYFQHNPISDFKLDIVSVDQIRGNVIYDENGQAVESIIIIKVSYQMRHKDTSTEIQEARALVTIPIIVNQNNVFSYQTRTEDSRLYKNVARQIFQNYLLFISRLNTSLTLK